METYIQIRAVPITFVRTKSFSRIERIKDYVQTCVADFTALLSEDATLVWLYGIACVLNELATEQLRSEDRERHILIKIYAIAQ